MLVVVFPVYSVKYTPYRKIFEVKYVILITHIMCQNVVLG